MGTKIPPMGFPSPTAQFYQCKETLVNRALFRLAMPRLCIEHHGDRWLSTVMMEESLDCESIRPSMRSHMKNAKPRNDLGNG